jgi:prepilin-type N-terminal cleavage/methylation domain-containing protein
MMTAFTIKKGFTLIELLVVMSIIALLTSVILTSLSGVRSKARDTRRLGDVRQVATALELYRTTNGTYPIVTSWRGYCTGFNSSGTYTTSGATGYIPNLAPNYIPTLPVDPRYPTTGCYLYQSNSAGTEYLFMAYGTVEGPVTPSMIRPVAPTEKDYAVYTSGAAAW